MIEFVPASRAHIGRIARRMREDDRIECAAFGLNPRQALSIALESSCEVATVMIDGSPHAMLGLIPVSAIEGIGRPWMLGSEELYRHGKAMLTLAPPVIAGWRDSLPRLRHIVGKGNRRAIRVLRRWGFAVGDEVTMIGGVPFLSFAMGD